MNGVGEKMKEEKHVVIVFPHPDDESFGTSGIIKKYREQGVPVTYLCGTLGEMGRNMGTPPFANRETLRDFREVELKDACDFLDINYEVLGFRDKTIEFEKVEDAAAVVKEALDRIEPSLVITHYPEHGVHPDHNALGVATIEAVRQMDPAERPTGWAAAITHNYQEELGEPDVVFEVEDFNHKLQAITKHKSQAEGLLEQMENDALKNDEALQALKERLGTEQFYIWQFED